MESTPGKLFEDDGEPVFSREVVGDDVVVFCHGMIVGAFRRGDELLRDVTIATLLRGGRGLTTDAIAHLCVASHGWVCNVRKRLRSGGLAAVLARGKPGPARLVVGRAEVRLREMHAAGLVAREIAKELAVSKELVAKEIKRLRLPPRGWGVAQTTLAGVGGGRVAKRSSKPAAGGEASVEPGATHPTDSGATTAQAEAPRTRAQEACDEEGGGAKMADDARASQRDEIGETVTVEAQRSGSGNSQEEDAQLAAGVPLRPGTEHRCRYAGTLLLCAAAVVIGVPNAIEVANAVRPGIAVYDSLQVLLALMAAWGAGYGSLEAMHERDARALGVVLGLERSPSVRTLHRAIAQMSAVVDPIELGAGLLRGVFAIRRPDRLWYGADGHFKAYAGASPIDKGWDSKRRIASKGIADVVITDERGWTWHADSIPAGDSLSKHLLAGAGGGEILPHRPTRSPLG